MVLSPDSMRVPARRRSSPTSGELILDAPTDDELIVSVRASDPAAYAELYRRHHRAAIVVALAITRDPDLAKDVVAETFASVLAALNNGAGPHSNFRRYLCAAVRNHAYRMGARARREVAVSDPPRTHVVEEQAIVSTLHDPALTEAFGRLPREVRRVLWLTAVDGWTPQELSQVLHVSPGTAAARAYRARVALRAAMDQVAAEELARRAPAT
jgi:RNA polymerase sigma factor (sigma-70 family)